ncbi:MATE family efflux transporter [Dehalobacter sp. DCM]|uniref:MATE family efflux transporter n=1 Tax=Dehalobacter sp. DCM TaxID=2907827 RepID=UPI003081A887|nr:MATE family efflux transporter [Dehalobacter sp. DCM]
MNQERIQILDSMSVYKAISRLALPTVLGMVVQILYNITDTFFIGKLNDPNQLAAITLAMPITMLTMAISSIIGTGGSAYLSRMIGANNFAQAQKTLNVSILYCVALGIFLTIISLLFLKPLVTLLGASTHTFSYTYNFCFIILLFSAVIMLNFSLGQLLRSEGAVKESLNGMLIGTVLNIVLNPVFVLILGMGIVGSAIATVIANFIGVIYYLCCYRSKSKQSMFALAPNKFSFDRTITFQMLSIGIPAALGQILMSVGNIVSNNYAAAYGDLTVASMGVATRAFIIPLFIILGIAIGCQPLMGFSFGAGNYTRLKEVVNKATFLCTITGLLFFVLFLLFSRQSMMFFSSNKEVIELGTLILHALILSLPFLGIQFTITTAVQSMGKVVPSLILSISRQGLLYIPAILILTKLFGFKGFIYSQAITDILIMIISIGVWVTIFRGLKKTSSEPETESLSIV